MVKINHLSVVLSLLLAASSCGPYTAQFNLRQMGRSASTLDLGAKSMSLWYSYMEASDSALVHKFSQKFADEMASAYGINMNIYARKSGLGEKLSSRDSMVNMLMAAGTDVVLLVDSKGLMYAESTMTKVDVFAYDSMNRQDKVYARYDVEFVEGTEQYQVQNLMAVFGPVWKSLVLKIVYYDYADWNEALEKMYSLELKQAMDIYFRILSKNPPSDQKQAAEYNVAAICYLMGDNALASEWLELSVADLNGGEEPAYIPSLRKKLNN